MSKEGIMAMNIQLTRDNNRTKTITEQRHDSWLKIASEQGRIKRKDAWNVGPDGYRAASTNPPDRAASSAPPDRAASSATPDRAASSATPDRAASSATPDRAASSATPDRVASTNPPPVGAETQCLQRFLCNQKMSTLHSKKEKAKAHNTSQSLTQACCWRICAKNR